jgi:hypothetical protein
VCSLWSSSYLSVIFVLLFIFDCCDKRPFVVVDLNGFSPSSLVNTACNMAGSVSDPILLASSLSFDLASALVFFSMSI